MKKNRTQPCAACYELCFEFDSEHDGGWPNGLILLEVVEGVRRMYPAIQLTALKV